MQDDPRQQPEPQPEPPFRPRVFRPEEIERERAPLPKPIAGLSKLERRQLAGLWTLTELYELYVWPHSLKPRKRKRATRDEHLCSLRKWEAICGHPPLAFITQELCSYFVQELEKQPGLDGGPMSPTTVVKHCVQLQMILDHAGPGNPRRKIIGAKLLKRKVIPYLQRPAKAKVEVQDALSQDELWRLLEATKTATTPQLAGIEPPAWWSGCYLFAYNTALRRQTVLAARWDWLDDEGWLAVPPDAIKREQGGRFYVNQYALRAVEPLRAAGYEEILPWPYKPNWFHACCRNLFATAGIKLRGGASRRRGLHRLRATALTWLAGENELIAKIVAGHRGGVLQEHYADRRVVVAFLRRIPQPRPPVQKELF